MDKVKLKIGPFLALDVVVKVATEKDDKDTALTTVCTGKPGADPHPPVKVNGLMRCSDKECGREESSYHPYPRGHDNGNGTYTIPSLEAVSVDRALVESIELTSYPAAVIEAKTLPFGRIYWLAPGKGSEKAYDTYARLIADTDVAYCSLYARSTAPVMYRVLVYSGLLALQELATPAMLKQRPALDVAPASDKDLAILQTMATSVFSEEWDPADFADTRQAVIAAALAAAEAQAAGVTEPLATVTQLPTGESDFAKAMRAAGMDPDAVTVPEPKKRAGRKVEAPPVQPLPSEVPANVDTSLVDAGKKKRAPRKSA